MDIKRMNCRPLDKIQGSKRCIYDQQYNIHIFNNFIYIRCIIRSYNYMHSLKYMRLII